jgi:diguanylate cyclase (GGDEF)-like protein/PAS domain S-box-containing protein
MSPDFTMWRASTVARPGTAERFAAIFDQAPTGLAVTDLRGTLLDVNQAFCDLTGHPARYLRGRALSSVVHPDDASTFALHYERHRADPPSDLSCELRFRHAAGHDVTVLVHTVPLRDRSGPTRRLLSHVRDVTRQRDFEQRLTHLADHDELTGLLNRRRFTTEVHAHVERCRRYGMTGAVLLLDLDNFKQVNDTYGHLAGDHLLQGVAQILRRTLRSTDLLARIGGDEFAVLLPRADVDDARAVSEKICRALREASHLDPGHNGRAVTVSIGLAAVHDPKATAEDVLLEADLGVYAAKDAGRNRVATRSNHQGLTGSARSRLVRASRIRSALTDQRFDLWAQPLMDLPTGEVPRYELLLRMTQDDGVMVAPTAFLDVAERSGLIVDIDSWVIRRAIAMLAELTSHCPQVGVNVNLSALSLSHRAVSDLVERELSLAQVEPARLGFEISAGTTSHALPVAREFAERVRALGCPVAVDDFGSGLGSFFSLRHLPFDLLKIDGGTVRGCRRNRTDEAVLRALVSVARSLGKRTVATLVEDEPTLQLLREEGVDLAQGYHIARPAPLRTFLSPVP